MVPPCSDRVSRAPPYSISPLGRFRVRGCHPLWRTFPDASANADCKQSLPNRLRADPLSLIATWGISVDFFSSGYLDISVPRVRLAHLCIQCAIAKQVGWVSPFGNPRIKVCCRLPEAYRRLPRPSSPSAAKASTECACSLDHITQSAHCAEGLAHGTSPDYLVIAHDGRRLSDHERQIWMICRKTHFRYFIGLSISAPPRPSYQEGLTWARDAWLHRTRIVKELVA